ncbi:MAG: tRNA (adenosine(37)-N6)-threonylcarbamoyltransferase complex transferase subunit TsaD, partial [Cyanobacteria bacterium J06659_2]
MATVLAIETSCDETAAAVVCDRAVISNVVASQIDTHQQYGGVVPELASRQHVNNLGWVVQQAIADANLGWADLDGIAATCAPGLVGALLMGLTAAKTLAMVHPNERFLMQHCQG